MKSSSLILFLTGLFCLNLHATVPPNVGPLLSSYYQYHLTEETTAQAERLTRDTAPDLLPEVQEGIGEWRKEQMTEVREVWVERFGSDASVAFQLFVENYTTASSEEDLGYLLELSASLDLGELAEDYAQLRRQVMQGQLAQQIESAASLLGNVEIWIELRSIDPGMLSLSSWLSRDKETSPPPQAPAQKKKKPSNPLRAAEIPLQDYQESSTPAVSTMDSLSGLRKERRAQALANAQEGMRQVANERRAAEEEYASAQMAHASAEASAVKAQAQKLATSEKEAIEQAKNSWGNRLKRIAGTTVSSTICAFTGGIGAVAADRAVQEVFN